MAHPSVSTDGLAVGRVWTITFVVIAALLAVFSLIAFLGLAQSDWFHGYGYGPINEDQWAQIANLRDRLAQLDLAPEAVNALDDALLLPHPTTEEVLFDLRKAAQALDRYDARASAHQIQTQLYTLIDQIKPGYSPARTPRSTPTPRPSPTLTPIIDAPVAQTEKNQ
jgi:hypothetical protein